ncbi:MAG: nickel/cobalt transporter [Xanthobacteraceae bacterium]|nr:nickel/cobalt transporter [Xanthobacteraceae bacterium]
MGRMAGACGVVLAVAALALLADGLGHAAAAQPPFGAAGAAASDAPGTGVVGWIIEMQSRFYRQISGTIRAAKQDGDAVWTLLAISFAYGVFHAAGPGHGKAVISSYLIANEETARRGVVLAFASALLQALVAVAIVGLGAVLLNITAKTMCGAQRAIEIASYALIAGFGAWLCWGKGRGLLRSLRAARRDVASIPSPSLAPALLSVIEPMPQTVPDHQASHHGAHHHHGHDHHDHGPEASKPRDPDHVHDEHCGHSHGPTPDQLAGPGGWRRGLGAIVAVGLRPCSGAILVLVFAMAQGLFGVGVAAALLMGLGTAVTVATIAILAVSAKRLARRFAARSDGPGTLLLRGIEFGAAVVVLLFGAGLLAGYVAAERAACL